MNCENLQFDLSIYADDILSETAHADVEKHLAQCPLCRQKRDDYLALSQSLRSLKRPVVSAELLNTVRNCCFKRTSNKCNNTDRDTFGRS